MDELRNNPQIIELLETLEENGMQKEKGEVSALVSYIGDMEHTLSAMFAEMQEMRKEVNMIHNSSVKAKCENLIHTADSKIHQGIETVSKAKNNLIVSAANAIKVFKEKGKEACSDCWLLLRHLLFRRGLRNGTVYADCRSGNQHRI